MLLLLALLASLVAVLFFVVQRKRAVAVVDAAPMSQQLAVKEERGSIPGMQPSDKVMGNLGDVGAAGSLHEFLVKLHAEHGEIASFYWMSDKVVSVMPSHWRSLRRLFDRPVSLFAGFMPLIGKDSIQYSNGSLGKSRRRAYFSPAFGHTACERHVVDFCDIAQRTVADIANASDASNIDMNKEMIRFALRTIVVSSLGGMSDEDIASIQALYDSCWSEMERQVLGDMPDEERQAKFERCLTDFRDIVARKAAISDMTDGKNDLSFVSKLMETNPSPDLLFSEVMTALVGGFHTTGNLLSWMLYFVLKNKDVLAKCKIAIKDVLGDEKIVPASAAKRLVAGYVGMVINETLRLSCLAPWAARVNESADVQLGDYTIDAGTPIIQPLGVALLDASLWKNVDTFDPSRFEAGTPAHFQPFGFAGGRVCPGFVFARLEAATMLAALLQNFEFELKTKQAKRVYGLVTHTDVPVIVSANKI